MTPPYFLGFASMARQLNGDRYSSFLQKGFFFRLMTTGRDLSAETSPLSNGAAFPPWLVHPATAQTYAEKTQTTRNANGQPNTIPVTYVAGDAKTFPTVVYVMTDAGPASGALPPPHSDLGPFLTAADSGSRPRNRTPSRPCLKTHTSDGWQTYFRSHRQWSDT